MRMMLYDFVIFLFCITVCFARFVLANTCAVHLMSTIFSCLHVCFMACSFFGGNIGLQQISSNINFIASGFRFCSLFGQGDVKGPIIHHDSLDSAMAAMAGYGSYGLLH